MALENIQEYSVSLEFDTAFKKLAKFQRSTENFNKRQLKAVKTVTQRMKMMREQEVADIKKRSQANNDYFKDLERQSEAAYKKDQSRLNKLNKNRRMAAVAGITAPSGASGMQSFYAKLEKESAEKVRKAEKERTRQGVKAAVSNITAPSGASDFKKFYEKQAKEAANTAKALAKAQESAKLTKVWLQEAANAEDAIQRKSFKTALNHAKSASEVKKILTSERNRLAVNKRNTAEIKRQSFLTNRMATSSKQFAGNMLSAFALVSGASTTLRVGQELQSAAIAMEAATGSAKKGREEMAFARREALRLGLNLRTTALDYAKLYAAGEGKLGTKDIRNIFLGVSEAATVMGLSNDDAAGTLRAVQQMMSKGKVTAEELRQQLGDRMAPAFKLMAKAVGVSTMELDKMMQKGIVFSDKYLPKFGQNLRDFAATGIDKALKSNINAMNDMKNAGILMAESLFGKSEKNLTTLFNQIAETLKETTPLWEALGKMFGTIFKALAAMLRAVTPLLKLFGQALKAVTDILGDFTVVVGLAFSMAARAAVISFFTGATTASNAFLASLKRTVIFLATRFAPLIAMFAWMEEVHNMVFGDGSKTGLMPVKEELHNKLKADKSYLLLDMMRSSAALGGGLAMPTTSTMTGGAYGQPPIELSVNVDIDGETVTEKVVKSNRFINGVEQAVVPMMGGR